METEFDVRVAGRADLPCMVRMAAAFRRELGRDRPSEAEFRQRIESLLDDTATDFLVALDGDGRCLGFLQQRYRRSIWTTGDEAYLEDLYVAEGSRRLGLGSRLVEMAVDMARARGCDLATLDTSERNVRAIALYERLGFRSGSDPASEVTGGRQLWLEKSL